MVSLALPASAVNGRREAAVGSPVERRRQAYRVVEVARVEELDAFLVDWEDLAGAAAEPNAFFEPWMLRPALDAYGRDLDLRFVFVYEERRGQAPLLCGFFPFERVASFHGLPIGVFRLWSYVHCFLGTPLVRAGHARATVGVLIRWLRGAAREHALLELPRSTVGGPVHEALLAHLRESAVPFIARRFERALFTPRESGEAYLREALRGKKRKEIRRLERRLGELGRVAIEVLDPAAGAGRADTATARTWADEFLALEAAGWKGRNGTALGCRPADREFFLRTVEAAHERGRLMMLALRLDGRAIASKCNFLAGDGAFSFKIAYDEGFARFSPGFLLEVETIRRLHTRPGLRWMDSCAVPGHPMADRLWLDRRELENLVIATGGRSGRPVLAALSLARRLADRAGGGDPRNPAQEV
ncbi:MAG TPA: GNAT family N-acetyltransferase [Thermoanaerobaculia bacterium]|nr:GNAT family N-acetyltransferase [Thermoanaerobaculia bacterium]